MDNNILASPWDFNPRSRVGSDPIYEGKIRWAWHFNPRSRVGSDRGG